MANSDCSSYYEPTADGHPREGANVRYRPVSTSSTSGWNLVAIAFKRDHQRLVDSWLPWFEDHAAADPGLRFYEVPTIGRIWAPVRNFIDGGMASAIREPLILQRTLTVYGDVNRLTQPLRIEDRSTIALLVVDGAGLVVWAGSGGFAAPLARDLESALAEDGRR